MWQATIVSTIFLIASASLCFAASVQDAWQPELMYNITNHEDSSNDTVIIIDAQAANIDHLNINVNEAQPWIVEILIRSLDGPDEYEYFDWGALIDRRAVIIRTSPNHQRLLDNNVYVGVGTEKIKVEMIFREPKTAKDTSDYMILILSRPIEDINAIRLAMRNDRFKVGTECFTVGIIPFGNTRRVVAHGAKENEFIYTERKHCYSTSGEGMDFFGILVCPREEGSSHVLSSNYVLASIIRASYHADPERCQIVYKKISNSRRWIDDVLEGPFYHAYERAIAPNVTEY